MPRHSANQPTEVELEILGKLWECKTATAREIHDAISESRETNYSTTVKMLSVMFEKGLVKRNDSIRPMTFSPASTQQNTQTKLLKGLLQKAYNGSVGSLVMQALSSKQATKAELEEIKALVKKLEEESQ